MQSRMTVMAIGLGGTAIVLSSAALGIAAAIAAFLATRPPGRRALAILLLATTFGCASVVTTKPTLRNLETRSLGFKGRLEGDAHRGLPTSITGALDPASDILFTYDERVTQAHDELPFVVLIVASPLHLFGVPTGRDEVQAHAELTMTRRGHEIGRYRGEAAASQTYGLYYGANMQELEDEARTAARRVIDEALYGDTARLTPQLDSPQP